MSPQKAEVVNCETRFRPGRGNIFKLLPQQRGAFPTILVKLINIEAWTPIRRKWDFCFPGIRSFPRCGKIPPKKILHRYQHLPGERKTNRRFSPDRSSLSLPEILSPLPDLPQTLSPLFSSGEAVQKSPLHSILRIVLEIVRRDDRISIYHRVDRS